MKKFLPFLAVSHFSVFHILLPLLNLLVQALNLLSAFLNFSTRQKWTSPSAMPSKPMIKEREGKKKKEKIPKL